MDMTPGVIRTPHQRAGFDVAKAHLIRFGLEVVKLFRRHVAFDLQLAIRRLQILTDSHDVDVVLTKVAQSRHDFSVIFANADHEA